MSKEEQPKTFEENDGRRERMLMDLLPAPQVSPSVTQANERSTSFVAPNTAVQTSVNRLNVMLQRFVSQPDIQQRILDIRNTDKKLQLIEEEIGSKLRNKQKIEALEKQWKDKLTSLVRQVEAYVVDQNSVIALGYALRHPDRRREVLLSRSQRDDNPKQAYENLCRSYDSFVGNPYDQSNWGSFPGNGKKKKGRHK